MMTLATGTSDTLTVVLAARPSLVAVITALPARTAVTIPVVLTVATEEALDDHVTLRSERSTPEGERRIVVSWRDVPPPGPTRKAMFAGSMTMVATGSGRGGRVGASGFSVSPQADKRMSMAIRQARRTVVSLRPGTVTCIRRRIRVEIMGRYCPVHLLNAVPTAFLTAA
jgi:hypothetical protein